MRSADERHTGDEFTDSWEITAFREATHYKSINKYLNYDFLHCHGAPQWLIGVSFGFQGDRTRSQYLLDRARLKPLICLFISLYLQDH